jgi:hypothetical protein
MQDSIGKVEFLGQIPEIPFVQPNI